LRISKLWVMRQILYICLRITGTGTAGLLLKLKLPIRESDFRKIILEHRRHRHILCA